MLTFGSVCSGVEAASVAWEPLGWQAQWFSEIEAFPSAVLAHRFPNVPNLGDMTKLHTRSEFNDRPIDLLVGGTPCQSFSVAGLRKGMADPRGNLALVYLSVADRKRPRWIVWENVPGVLSSGGGRDFGAFLGGLGQLGYGFSYRVLDAQYFGVAQRRRRVFVIGCLGDWRPAAAVLFEPHSMQGHPAPRRTAGEGTAAPTAPSLTASGRGVSRTGESRGQDPVVAHTLRAEHDASEDGTGRGVPLVAGCLQHRDAKGADSDTKPGHLIPVALHENQRGELTTSLTAGSLKAGGGKPGQGYAAVLEPTPINTMVGLRHNKLGEGTGLGVGVPGDASYTITKGHSHAVQHGMAVRRLTPRECERLQGFPDDWTLVPYRGKPAADGPRYKAMGNSMAVPVMRWIGQRIKQFEQGDL